MCLAAISHVEASERESELAGGVRSNQPRNRRWNKWDCPRRLKQQHVRSGPVITEAAGLTSCSVSAGYCFPPRRGVSSRRFANVLGFALHLRLHSLARSPAALVFAAAVEEVVASVRRTCAEELSRPRRSHPFHGSWLASWRLLIRPS